MSEPSLHTAAHNHITQGHTTGPRPLFLSLSFSSSLSSLSYSPLFSLLFSLPSLSLSFSLLFSSLPSLSLSFSLLVSSIPYLFLSLILLYSLSLSLSYSPLFSLSLSPLFHLLLPPCLFSLSVGAAVHLLMICHTIPASIRRKNREIKGGGSKRKEDAAGRLGHVLGDQSQSDGLQDYCDRHRAAPMSSHFSPFLEAITNQIKYIILFINKNVDGCRKVTHSMICYILNAL